MAPPVSPIIYYPGRKLRFLVLENQKYETGIHVIKQFSHLQMASAMSEGIYPPAVCSRKNVRYGDRIISFAPAMIFLKCPSSGCVMEL